MQEAVARCAVTGQDGLTVSEAIGEVISHAPWLRSNSRWVMATWELTLGGRVIASAQGHPDGVCPQGTQGLELAGCQPGEQQRGPAGRRHQPFPGQSREVRETNTAGPRENNSLHSTDQKELTVALFFMS